MLEIKEININRISPWLANPRNNEHAVKAVAESIKNFGFNVPIICDKKLTIIAGHTRWKAAKLLKMKTIPVITINMTDSNKYAFAITDNKTAELADWNLPELRNILEELASDDFNINSLGFSKNEIRRLLFNEDNENNSITEIAGLQPKTKSGDIYSLGKHRLLCGDCRNINSVLQLSEGNKIGHVFGGPPYFNQRIYSHWEEYSYYLEDMKKVIQNCNEIMQDGAVCVWNIANGCSTHHDHVGHHSMLFEQSGFKYLDTIIWKKRGANYAIPRNFHISRNSYYYPALEWEALLVYQKPGPMPKMTKDGRNYMSLFHTDVWEIAAVTNQLEKFGHPAVCPEEIPYRSIQAYTNETSIIFEPFGGSGTTLIAAEKASRKSYVTEMNPLYCDMIITRWEKLTGRKAVRING